MYNTSATFWFIKHLNMSLKTNIQKNPTWVMAKKKKSAFGSELGPKAISRVII